MFATVSQGFHHWVFSVVTGFPTPLSTTGLPPTSSLWLPCGLVEYLYSLLMVLHVGWFPLVLRDSWVVGFISSLRQRCFLVGEDPILSGAPLSCY